MPKGINKCEICGGIIGKKDSIQSGVSKRFYYFKKYRGKNKKLTQIASYHKKCYEELKNG